jgi:general secretion pathway protein M
MKDWFEALDVRERLIVMGGGVFLAFALLYVSIWQPLDREQSTRAANVQSLRQSIAELKPLKVSLGASGSGSATISTGTQSLVVIIDTTLRERGLYSSLQRSQPTRDNGIRIEFENAPFDDLVLWLGDLGGRYGLQVVSGSFSIPAQGTQGWVNASITLER